VGKRVVFFDRDGTLSKDKGYTFRPEELHIYPGAGRALGRLKRAGYVLAIVTNQSAVGRGMCELKDVEATNAECLRQLLAEDSNARVDTICLCPHAPEENCDCRKPRTGMLRQLKEPVDFAASWMVGDKCLDIEFGLTAGCSLSRCVLLLTGEGEKEVLKARERWGNELQVCEDMETVANKILGVA